ncbi:hypothetical protein D3C85_1339370 [compost metagenome]
MVPDLGGVVEDAARGGLDDLFQGFTFEFGARNQVVQVHHVGVVVLAVVVFQGLGGQVRLESVLLVRQRRQFESHVYLLHQVGIFAPGAGPFTVGRMCGYEFVLFWAASSGS